jgi:hypothetical protein
VVREVRGFFFDADYADFARIYADYFCLLVVLVFGRWFLVDRFFLTLITLISQIYADYFGVESRNKSPKGICVNQLTSSV